MTLPGPAFTFGGGSVTFSLRRLAVRRNSTLRSAPVSNARRTDLPLILASTRSLSSAIAGTVRRRNRARTRNPRITHRPLPCGQRDSSELPATCGPTVQDHCTTPRRRRSRPHGNSPCQRRAVLIFRLGAARLQRPSRDRWRRGAHRAIRARCGNVPRTVSPMPRRSCDTLSRSLGFRR